MIDQFSLVKDEKKYLKLTSHMYILNSDKWFERSKNIKIYPFTHPNHRKQVAHKCFKRIHVRIERPKKKNTRINAKNFQLQIINSQEESLTYTGEREREKDRKKNQMNRWNY